MKQQGIPQACYHCVLDQAESAAKHAKLSEANTTKVLKLAAQASDSSTETGIVVQQIVRLVADEIIKLKKQTAEFDIYHQVKQHSNELALSYRAQLREKIKHSITPLDTALQISAAGNIIDFGAKSHSSLDIDKELQEINHIGFQHYDIDAIKSKLAMANKLLFICDNAGEIVFDCLLIEQLQQSYPQLTIIAALRDKPIINDATLIDAQAVGMTQLVEVISSGSVYPGTLLSETSSEFQQHYHNADLLIAKGQGNYETLLPIAQAKLFFLLRIKCEHMANLSGVKQGNLVLLQGNQHSL